MQIKPFFEKYKEIKRIPLGVDDAGFGFSLVHFKGLEKVAKNKKGKYVRKPRKFNEWRVLMDKKTIWQNGAISYEEEVHYQNANNRILDESYMNSIKVDKFELFPVYAGATAIVKDGIRVYFHVRKIAWYKRIFKNNL